MKTYYLEVPIYGVALVSVEAGSEDEAIDQAMETVDQFLNGAFALAKMPHDIAELQEFGAIRVIQEGNISYIPVQRVTVDVEPDDNFDEEE